MSDTESVKKEIKYTEVQHSETAFNDKNDVVDVKITQKQEKDTGPVNRKFLYISACVANLIAYTAGLGFGWTSPEIPKLKLEEGNPLGAIINPTQESWIGGFLPVGAIVGPFAAGALADRIGRKKTILLCAVPYILAFLLSAYASTVNMFYVARFLMGLGAGAVFTVVPMYIAEIAENEVRGTLGSFLQLFVTIGLLFSFSVGPFTSIKLFNLACVVVPAAFMVIYFMFIPESPYYLLQTNDIDGAEASLMKLRSKSKQRVQNELFLMKENVEESMSNKASFMDIFKTKALTNAFILSVGLVSLQQLTGINIVIFYAQDIFKDAGSSLAPEIATIVIGVVQVVGSSLAPMLVERKGKRFLLILSSIGMAVAHAILGYFFYLKESGSDVSAIAIIPVCSLIFYIVAYNIGFGPLPFAVLAEVFPSNVKSVAATVAAATCWLLGFIITKYFILLVGLVGKSGSFGLFAICCVIAAGFVYKLLPNTEGKSLQEIQEMLGK